MGCNYSLSFGVSIDQMFEADFQFYLQPFVKAHSQLHLEEDDDEEETEEELGHTDTYSNYVPSKCK